MKTIYKNLINSLILGAVAVSFSACAGSQLPEQQLFNNGVKVEKFDNDLKKYSANEYLKPYDNIYIFTYTYFDISNALNLKEAANIGKTKGFKYFEIIEAYEDIPIREKIDNKTPITNIQDYLVYRGMENKFSDEGHSLNGSVKKLKVNYRNNAPKDTFVWNVEEVLKEELVFKNPYSLAEDKSDAIEWKEKLEKKLAGSNIKYTIINRD